MGAWTLRDLLDAGLLSTYCYRLEHIGMLPKILEQPCHDGSGCPVAGKQHAQHIVHNLVSAELHLGVELVGAEPDIVVSFWIMNRLGQVGVAMMINVSGIRGAVHEALQKASWQVGCSVDFVKLPKPVFMVIHYTAQNILQPPPSLHARMHLSIHGYPSTWQINSCPISLLKNETHTSQVWRPDITKASLQRAQNPNAYFNPV